MLFFQKKNSKEKYINFWTQIATEFVNFDEHLIFESINKFNYDFIFEEENNNNQNNDYFEDFEEYYMNLFNSSQEFIYTVRNSGGYNSERLLVISELVTEVEIYFFLLYFETSIPKDPANKLAVSLNYWVPSKLNEEYGAIAMEWYYKYGFGYSTIPMTEWGIDNDYRELMKNFDFLKKYYINEGIPVIISEVGILTEKNKDINSFREFLYSIFSISSEIKGLMSCLWDVSEKIQNEMNYYDKEKNIWKDTQIRDNFINISKGKYVNSSKYYSYTNIEAEKNILSNYLNIDIGDKKVLKIIINARISCDLHYNCDFLISTYDKDGNYYEFFLEDYGKKQYDGTSIFTIDANDIDCNENMEVFTFWGNENDIIFNNITVVYKNYFQYFDYKKFKSAVIKEIK